MIFLEPWKRREINLKSVKVEIYVIKNKKIKKSISDKYFWK